LMKVPSTETSVLTSATLCHIPEDDILLLHTVSTYTLQSPVAHTVHSKFFIDVDI
jgi:hypothetical protein